MGVGALNILKETFFCPVNPVMEDVSFGGLSVILNEGSLYCYMQEFIPAATYAD
jgi:hypothetical protein